MAKTKLLNPDDVLTSVKARVQPKMDAVDELGAAWKALIAQEDDAARRRTQLDTELARAKQASAAAYKTAWGKATQAGWAMKELRASGFPAPEPATRKPRRATATPPSQALPTTPTTVAPTPPAQPDATSGWDD